MHSACPNLMIENQEHRLSLKTRCGDFQCQDLGPSAHALTSLDAGIVILDKGFQHDGKYTSNGEENSYTITLFNNL